MKSMINRDMLSFKLNNYLLILGIWILSSCNLDVKKVNSSTYSTSSGQSIENGLREEMQKKNTYVFERLFAQDISGLRKVISDAFANENPQEFDQQMKAIGTAMSSPNFILLNEFYTNASEPLLDIKISADFGNPDTNDYTLEYRSNATETYVSLMLHQSGQGELLFIHLYGKYNNEWKLDLLATSWFTNYGFTSLQYYLKSRDFYEEGDLVNAYIFRLYSEINSKPCPGIFSFDIQTEMQTYYRDMDNTFFEIYEHPILMEDIASQPEILTLGLSALDPSEYLPTVQYKTKIAPGDTKKINLEKQEIIDRIEDVYPNLRLHFNAIILNTVSN